MNREAESRRLSGQADGAPSGPLKVPTQFVGIACSDLLGSFFTISFELHPHQIFGFYELELERWAHNLHAMVRPELLHNDLLVR